MEDNNVREQVEDGYYIPDLPLSPPAPSPEYENVQTTKKKKKKKEKDVFTWKDDVVYYLINKWQQEPVLYNIKNPDYHDKPKRQQQQ